MSDLIYSHYYENEYGSRHATKLLVENFKVKSQVELNICSTIYVSDEYGSVIDFVFADLDQATKVSVAPGNFVAYDNDLLIVAHINAKSPFDSLYRRCDLEFYGTREAVKKSYKRLEAYQNSNKKSNVTWWFKAGNDIKNVTFPLNSDQVFKQEYYPWIPNVDEYIANFKKSKASILILLGEPGTGKTSFIRNMLNKTNDDCYTTYDEEVMGSDEIYIRFVEDLDVGFLVLEDSDLLLTDRIHDRNRVMSKILNASDGLVSFAGKKMIFTANIVNTDKIDEALLRPGRCFDVLKFRPLSQAEAANAAIASGKILTGKTDSYTLAEIFNK